MRRDEISQHHLPVYWWSTVIIKYELLRYNSMQTTDCSGQVVICLTAVCKFLKLNPTMGSYAFIMKRKAIAINILWHWLQTLMAVPWLIPLSNMCWVAKCVIACSAVAQQCVKAHMQSQWRKQKFDPVKSAKTFKTTEPKRLKLHHQICHRNSPSQVPAHQLILDQKVTKYKNILKTKEPKHFNYNHQTCLKIVHHESTPTN